MNKPSSYRRGIRIALLAIGGAVALVLAVFVLISLQIGSSVRAASAVARACHQGDSVEALIRYVEDGRHSLWERNRAVWALGQLGDRRALAVLREHYSGGPCHHNEALCQGELGKAINLLDGGMNVTAFWWRSPAGK